jgi:hypothetical protein
MKNCNYTTKDTHVSLIRVGDTVLYNGQLKTVNQKYLNTRDQTLFGDSFRCGTIPVKKVIFQSL